MHVEATLNAEDGALLREALDRRLAADRQDGGPRSLPQRRRGAFLDLVRHHADCREGACPGRAATGLR